MRRERRRQPVEVYFILYLTALILLLPDGQKNQSNEPAPILTALLQSSFAIAPDKSVLTCVLEPTSNGITIRYVDSVAIIRPIGAVRSVEYAVTVVDLASNDTYTMAQNGQDNARFGFSVLDDKQTGRFVWHPLDSKTEPRTLLVKIRAVAVPEIPPSIRDEAMREQVARMIEANSIRLNASSEFTLNIVSSSDAPGMGSPVLIAGGNGTGGGDSAASAAGGNSGQPFVQPPSLINEYRPVITLPSQGSLPRFNTPVSLSPQYFALSGLAKQRWKNTVRVGGLSLRTDLVGSISVNTENGDPSASVSAIRADQGEFDVVGEVPDDGRPTNVTVALQRSDGQSVSLTFTVTPLRLAPPKVPAVLYPGIREQFDPELPLLTGQETKAVLFDGNEERYTSWQGEAFTFIAEAKDIGRTLTLRRYVNGNPIGENISVAVRDFPAPRIVDANAGRQKATLTVVAYGLPGSIESRARLVVPEGIRVVELHGNYTYDKQKHAHIQVFDVSSADGSELRGTVSVFDRRNRKGNSVKLEPGGANISD